MRDATRRPGWAWAFVALSATVAAAGAGPAAGRTGTADDLLFRPTVIVRCAGGQGSGTVIASVDGETLVLTAAHVVREGGPIGVELHRYNLGVEGAMPRNGWPVTLAGTVAAADTMADVAVVRVRGRSALPYVARLGGPGDEPGRGGVVTSVGVDGGARLESWSSHVDRVAWFALFQVTRKTSKAYWGAENAPTAVKFRPVTRSQTAGPLDPGDRPFLLTVRAGEHGRSGGGLFLEGDDHKLIGVCVGRVEIDGELRGVFSSGEGVRRLLRAHDLDTVIARSEAARDSRPGKGHRSGASTDAWFKRR